MACFHEAAHLLQGTAAHHEAGAGAHHRIPGAAHRFDPAVEALLIRQQPGLHRQVAHHRIGIEEVLGRLHKGHLGIQQQADGALEKVLLGHEVGIENGHQLALAQGQTGVEVAGLGVAALGPVVVTAAVALGQGCHLRAGRRHRAARAGGGDSCSWLQARRQRSSTGRGSPQVGISTST